jgi:hypothetical protein
MKESLQITLMIGRLLLTIGLEKIVTVIEGNPVFL